MTTTADITTATTAANLIADANTKAAVLAAIAVLTDLNTAILANAAAIAANPYVSQSNAGGILPSPVNTDPVAGAAELDLTNYISIPGRISSAKTQNNPLLNFNSSFTLGAATKSSAYTDTSMAFIGGSGSGYSAAVVDPTLLPPGVTMATNGHFSGTPTTDGVFIFAVTLTDDAGDSISAAFQITVTG
jgi:hypothetical protein